MREPPIQHPIIGDGYYPITDEALETELAGAEIVDVNTMFESFTLIVGYRDAILSANGKTAQPFVCIQNHAPGALHLFITKD